MIRGNSSGKEVEMRQGRKIYEKNQGEAIVDVNKQGTY